MIRKFRKSLKIIRFFEIPENPEIFEPSIRVQVSLNFLKRREYVSNIVNMLSCEQEEMRIEMLFLSITRIIEFLSNLEKIYKIISDCKKKKIIEFFFDGICYLTIVKRNLNE